MPGRSRQESDALPATQPAEQPEAVEDVEQEAPQGEQIVRWTAAPGTLELARERLITVNDWKAANVMNMEEAKPISWNAWNNYSVPRAEFGFLSDHEFNQFVAADPAFAVEDVSG